MFVSDYVLNGRGHGPVGEAFAACRYDAGLMRPYFDKNNVPCVTLNTGRTNYDEKTGRYVPVYEKARISDVLGRGVSSPVLNATTLRKDEWILLDRQVQMATRQRLRLWSDLLAKSPYGGFDGMAKTILENESMSDPGEAVVDMDGLSPGRTDAPKYQLEGLPLPITHADFWFSARRLAASRNSGTPLDFTMAEASARRVAETIERTAIGTVAGLTYGDSTRYSRAAKVYGLTNYPARITKTDLTTPTGANPDKTVEDVIEMRELLYSKGFYGPFMLYHSTDWDAFFDRDYGVVAGTSYGFAPGVTLRTRLKQIEGIEDVRRLDFLPATTNPFTLIMLQMTSDVARAVVGMDVVTVQWESRGGMQQNFKIMTIQVPHFRSDINGNCGICHGTTS